MTPNSNHFNICDEAVKSQKLPFTSRRWHCSATAEIFDTNTLMPVKAVVGLSFRTAVPTRSEVLVFPEMFFQLRSLDPKKFFSGQCCLTASWVLSSPGERHGRQQDPKPLPLLRSLQSSHRVSVSENGTERDHCPGPQRARLLD